MKASRFIHVRLALAVCIALTSLHVQVAVATATAHPATPILAQAVSGNPSADPEPPALPTEEAMSPTLEPQVDASVQATPTITLVETTTPEPSATATVPTTAPQGERPLRQPRIRLETNFEVSAMSAGVRGGQTVHGALRAQWVDAGTRAITPTQPFTAQVVFPPGLAYLPGSSTGVYDSATRRLTWAGVRLTADRHGQLVLPFHATVEAQATPARLAVRAEAQGLESIRFNPKITQLHVTRIAPGQIVSARRGGRFEMGNGKVRVDVAWNSIPGETVVITGVEYAVTAPSTLLPGIPPQQWQAMADAARRADYEDDADIEQNVAQDITRLTLAEPLLQAEFFPSMAFSRPVTLTFDLGEQVAAEIAASGLEPVLQYVNRVPYTYTYDVSSTLSLVVTGTRVDLENIPTWYDPTTGRLTAFIGHFSGFQAVLSDPTLPHPWKMVPGLGEVNVFRGAYTYDYPIAVPPMQDNLAPDLTLRYNSSQADTNNATDMLGRGWSLELPRVTRKMRQTAWVSIGYYPIEQGPIDDPDNCPNPPAWLESTQQWWCWYVVGTTQNIDRYELEWENKFTLNFGGRDHYLVHKAGREYVTLNYTPLRIFYCNSTTPCNDYPVAVPNHSGQYWQVWTPDGVRYVFGTDQNSEALMRWGQLSENKFLTQAWYLKAVYAPYRDDPSPGVNRASVQYVYTQTLEEAGEYETYLTEVRYGNSLRADGTTVGAQYSVTLDYVNRTARLRQPLTITVRAEGNTLRQYGLSYDGVGGITGTQNLKRIQEIAPDGMTLPAATFTYTAANNRYFMTQAANGYGGSVSLGYYFARGGYRLQARQHADAVTNWRDYTYYLYYDETITDTLHPTGYSPCFDWVMTDVETGASLCRVSGYDFTASGTNRLIGYPIVEEQFRNPDNINEWLGVVKHYYKFEPWRLGQEFLTRQEGQRSAVQYTVGEPPVSERWVTHTLQLTTGLPAGVQFGAAFESIEYPDLRNRLRYKRTMYLYEPQYQGGTQYGQTTSVWEYNSGTLVRVKGMFYSMNTANWTLRTTNEVLYDSAVAWAGETRYYHNTQGDVIFAQDLMNAAGSVTKDTAIGYDLLGNVVSQTVFTAWGNVWNPSGAGRSGDTTRHAYDWKFGYYLVTVTNPLNQNTLYFYYGVNETMPTAGQPFGLLKAVRDPNSNLNGSGVIQTVYAYDVFGRLRKVAKPGDSLSAASEEYQYYDGAEAMPDGTRYQTTATARSGNANPLLVVHLTRGGSGTHFADTGVAAWERSFYDGLGRVLQTQSGDVDAAGAKDRVTYSQYDALGRAYAQSVPYFVAPYSYATTPVNNVWVVQTPYLPPDLSKPRSTTQYDTLGRAVGASGPDGATTTSSFVARPDAGGSQVAISINPRYYRRDSISDMLGRLVAVREYTALPWTREEETNSSVSAAMLCSTCAPSYARVTKPAPYPTPDPVDHFIMGPGNDLLAPVAGPGQVVQFRIAINSAAGSDAYVGNINIHDLDGSGDEIIAIRWLRRSEFKGGLENFTEFALPFNTIGRLGHRLELRVWWAGNEQMAVDRTTLYWTNAASQLTTYQYDERDNLTRVTDALGHSTAITYDTLGRKTAMNDPDMGVWAYGYDVKGNLTSQTDARGQALWFGYDTLGRLTQKRLNDASGTLLAAYGYGDEGVANGIGRRISMSNTESNAAWQYDTRGRVITDVRTLDTGGGGGTQTFTTTYAYDAADRLVTTKYPDGSESVTNAYDAAGHLWASTGISNYVASATYNALGQPVRLNLGNGLSTRYRYYGLEYLSSPYGPTWSYGRVRQVCVIDQDESDCPDGIAGQSLLNLAHAYDVAGNLTNLGDRTRSANHRFYYDGLDRLISAEGAYTQTYSYDAIGNLTGKAEATLYYESAQPHAVTSLTNGAPLPSEFQYDANGNMVKRIEVTTTHSVGYKQAWSADNRLQAVISATAATYFGYDADGTRVRRAEYAHGQETYTDSFTVLTPTQWTYSALAVLSDTGTSDGLVLKLTGTGSGYTHTLRLTETLTSGESAGVDFQVSGPETGLLLMLERDRGLPSYARLAAYAHGGKLWVQYNLGDGTFVEPQALLPVLQPNTWYRLTLRVDDVDGFKLEVRERGLCTTPAQACAGSYRLRLPGGRTWRFGASLYSGVALLDNYVEREDRASQTLYASGVYERETVSTTVGLVVTKTYYYQFGSQQVAMRQAGVVYYLHGDHLGSASLTTDGTGYKVAELRYYPFGETRYTWGSTPTDKRFTGQIELADIGLYDYGARAYSPLLGRFISADSIVPQPSDPQSLNRYAYTRNSPLVRIDPTGHADTCNILLYTCNDYGSDDPTETAPADDVIYDPPTYESDPGVPDPEYIDRITTAYSNDTYMLAKTIFNEQRSLGYRPMWIAAWVITNRVKNKHGGYTTLEEILTYTGFYGYTHGLDPVVEAKRNHMEQVAWGIALRIADQALYGLGNDPAEGMEYFINFNAPELVQAGYAKVEGWELPDFAQYLADYETNHPGFKSLVVQPTNMVVFNDWEMMKSLEGEGDR